MPRIGLISDTHGLLREEAVDALRGSDHILHAGDIGNAEILERLARLAPLTAVRGNNDRGAWADALAHALSLQFEEVSVYLVHDVADLPKYSESARPRVIVTGHSHVPKIHSIETTLFVNPGSAGPRRFKLPITVGELSIEGEQVAARIIELRIAKT